MINIILSLLIAYSLSLPVEPEVISEKYTIGRFTLIKDSCGYYATTSARISNYYPRADMAIKELRKLEDTGKKD